MRASRPRTVFKRHGRAAGHRQRHRLPLLRPRGRTSRASSSTSRAAWSCSYSDPRFAHGGGGGMLPPMKRFAFILVVLAASGAPAGGSVRRQLDLQVDACAGTDAGGRPRQGRLPVQHGRRLGLTAARPARAPGRPRLGRRARVGYHPRSRGARTDVPHPLRGASEANLAPAGSAPCSRPRGVRRRARDRVRARVCGLSHDPRRRHADRRRRRRRPDGRRGDARPA